MTTENRDILEAYNYDPLTGNLTYAYSRGPVHEGDIAGYSKTNNIRGTDYTYRGLMFKGKSYKAHRIAFLFQGIELDSSQEIIHKDGNRSNNIFSNLEISDRTAITRSRALQSNNTSGYRGISYCKYKKNPFMVNAGNGPQRIYVGIYRALDDAIIARDAALTKLEPHHQQSTQGEENDR